MIPQINRVRWILLLFRMALRLHRGQESPNSSITCSMRVGLIRLLRLALGAASGKSIKSSTSLNIGCRGDRMATVFSPAETISGTFFFFLLRMIESGPGQNKEHICLAVGVSSATVPLVQCLAHAQ